MSGSGEEPAGERLLREVCERPDEDAARLAYAQWLAERGDPRGEFIRLQCAAPRHKTNATLAREEKLLASNETAWLGPLASRIGDTEWDRGFLASCTLAHPSPAWLREQREDPGWATLEALELERWWGEGASAAQIADFVAAPRMKSLRRLGGVTLPLLELLVGRVPQLEAIGLRPVEPPRQAQSPASGERAAALLRQLPALRRLALELVPGAGPSSLAWFWLSELPSRLESLEAGPIAESELPRWHRWLSEHEPKAVEEVVFSHGTGRDGWALGFARAPVGDWSVMRYQSFAPAGPCSLRSLTQTLRMLPRDSLTRLVVEPRRLRSEEIHDLEDALSCQPRVTSVEVQEMARWRSALYSRAK